MLGTNDTKVNLNRTPFDIAAGMGVLATQVLASAGGWGRRIPRPRS